MSKLYRARSLLYRRQILQQDIRWKALDQIYKIYMLLHRSDLNISEIFRQFFSHFLAKIAKIRYSLASSYVRTAQLSIALADCLNVAQYGTTARKQSNSSLRKGQGKGRLKKGHGS